MSSIRVFVIVPVVLIIFNQLNEAGGAGGGGGDYSYHAQTASGSTFGGTENQNANMAGSNYGRPGNKYANMADHNSALRSQHIQNTETAGNNYGMPENQNPDIAEHNSALKSQHLQNTKTAGSNYRRTGYTNTKMPGSLLETRLNDVKTRLQNTLENDSALGSQNTKVAEKISTSGSQDTEMTAGGTQDYDEESSDEDDDEESYELNWDESDSEIDSEEYKNFPYTRDSTPGFTCFGVISEFGFMGISGVDCLIIHDVVKYSEMLNFIHQKFLEHIAKLAEERNRLAQELDRETDEAVKEGLQHSERSERGQLVEAEKSLKEAEVQSGDLKKHMEYVENEDKENLAALNELQERLPFLNESLKDFMDNILDIGTVDTDKMEKIQAYQARLEGRREKLAYLQGYMDHVNVNTESCKMPETQEISRLRTVPTEELPPSGGAKRNRNNQQVQSPSGVKRKQTEEGAKGPVQSPPVVKRKQAGGKLPEPQKDMRQDYCILKKKNST